MIVLDDKRILIITPPHTASGNLHRALCSPEHGAFWCIGPSPEDGSPDHHYARVANGKNNYHIALVVRNPLDRLVGLYWHYVYGCKYLAKINKWWDFPNFVEEVAVSNMDLFYIYRWPINKLVGDLRIDSLIRYESLEEDVRKLCGDVTIESSIDNDWRQPYTEMYDKRRLQLAADWAREDFENYGYSLPADI